MKFISRRISHAVVIGLTGSFVLACSALLFLPPAAYGFSLDRQGAKEYSINCPASDIDLVDFAYAEGKTTYTFSGHCSHSSYENALPNFPYTIKGSWSQVSSTATEVVTSTYGTYSKSGLCLYDPWLDPTVACQSAPGVISNDSDVMKHLKTMLDTDYYFPSSKGPFENYRPGVLNKILNQSIKIVQPEDNKKYDYPVQLTARVTTDRLVSPAAFPKNLVAVLQIDEHPQWPDPNKPAHNPRSFALVQQVVHPGGSNLPYAEFPMGNVDLWGSGWWAKAHLLVADPYWTPTVSFFVGPSEQLGEPPVQPPFHDALQPAQVVPDVKPTALNQLAVVPNHKNLPRRLFIISPQAGQTVVGDLTLKLQLWGFPEDDSGSGPEIALDWTWSPFVEPGAFPPTPKTMAVRPKMQGTELVIPRSVFKENGIWSLSASIKESENKTIFDRVSFKIRDVNPVAGQLQLAPTVQAKLQSASPQPTGTQLIKTPESGQKMAVQGTLKPSSRVESSAAKGARGQSPAAEMKAPKPAPKIIKPSEQERFAKTGPVPISTQVSAADATLVWEIEYQAFGASSFARQPRSVAALAAGGGKLKTARLMCATPGTYRFRVKEEGDQARWSSWRTVVVGSPPALAPAAKTLQPKAKPGPATDAVKKMGGQPTREQPAKTLQQPEYKKIEPVTIQQPKAPVTIQQPKAPVAIPRQ